MDGRIDHKHTPVQQGAVCALTSFGFTIVLVTKKKAEQASLRITGRFLYLNSLLLSLSIYIYFL